MPSPQVNPPIRTIWQLRNGLFFSATNAATWVIALGSPLVLLLETLKATAFQVGLAYSFVFLLAPIQVLSTALLPKLGFRRQVAWAWAARGVFLIIPISIAIAAPVDPSPWMAPLVVAAVFFFCLFRAIGSCCYAPWIYALLPDHLRGRYFSTDSLLASVTGMLTLLFCAWINTSATPYSAYAWQFTVAALGAAAAVFFLCRIPNAPAPKTISLAKLTRQVPQLILTPGSFRHFLTLCMVAAAISAPFAPFAVYFLKVESSLSDGRILVFTALQYGGAILGSSIARSWVDRLGIRPFHCLALLINIAVFSLWILFISGNNWIQPLIGITFLMAGVAQACWYAAQMRYLPQLSADEDRPVAVSTLTSIIGLVAGSTPIIWGILLKAGDGLPGINRTAFLCFFLIAIIGHIILLPKFLKLMEDNTNTTPIHPAPWLARPFRFLFSMPMLHHSNTDQQQTNDEESKPDGKGR